MLQPINYKAAPKEVFDTFRLMYKQSFRPALIAQIIHGIFLGFFIVLIISGFVIAYMFMEGYFSMEGYQIYCLLFLFICIFCCLMNNALKDVLNMNNPLKDYKITMFKSEYGVLNVLGELAKEPVVIFRPPVYSVDSDNIDKVEGFFANEYCKERDVFILEYKNPKDDSVRLYHIVDPQLIKPIFILWNSEVD